MLPQVADFLREYEDPVAEFYNTTKPVSEKYKAKLTNSGIKSSYIPSNIWPPTNAQCTYLSI